MENEAEFKKQDIARIKALLKEINSIINKPTKDDAEEEVSEGEVMPAKGTIIGRAQ